jgi:CRP-like cAMP-binding protein
MSVEEHYKKGDKIFEEGDLFQRVYTITSGIVYATQNGKLMGEMGAGDIIGYDFRRF